jgi:uncharacterized damage-inducible protein DinB
MKSHYQELLAYNQSSNTLAASLIQNYQDILPENTFGLYCHMLNAQHVWNRRILEMDEIYSVWEVHSSEELEKINQAEYELSLYILENKALEEQITYKTSKGIQYTSSVNDILFHIINHSTYHRGQVMDHVRQVGGTAVSTDFIFYKR